MQAACGEFLEGIGMLWRAEDDLDVLQHGKHVRSRCGAAVGQQIDGQRDEVATRPQRRQRKIMIRPRPR